MVERRLLGASSRRAVIDGERAMRGWAPLRGPSLRSGPLRSAQPRIGEREDPRDIWLKGWDSGTEGYRDRTLAYEALFVV